MPPILLVPNKERTATSATELPAAFRVIERWANQLPSGAGYASLTGPGQTTTPGQLTQQGSLDVESGAGFVHLHQGTPDILPISSPGISIISNNGILIDELSAGNVQMESTTGTVTVQAGLGGQLTLSPSSFPRASLGSNDGLIINSHGADYGIQINDNSTQGISISESNATGPIALTATGPINLISSVGIFIQNVAGTPPTPIGGGTLYTQAGALKYIGSSGTITTIAPA